MIEIIVTLSIASIVMASAIPNFTQTIKDNRLTAKVNEFVTALNLARSEALKRGVRVTLCKSTDGGTCSTSGDWSQGWIVFTDQNSNSTFQSASESLLKIYANPSNQVTISANTNISNYVYYKPIGTSLTGTFTFCDDRQGAFGKQIVISGTGRPKIVSGAACNT